MKTILLLMLLSAQIVRAEALSVELTIDVNKLGVKVSPLLYGIFFEEINRAGDGGLYAEMVQNRSFEDATKPVAWTSLTGEMALDKTTPLNANNPTSLRFNGSVANEGFAGMSVVKGAQYELSL